MKTLKPCGKCDGKPAMLYQPGSTYSICVMRDKACPCLERAPDEDYEELAKRINTKNLTK